nr:MAG TPA: hypothetical protein [Caudoviricetes sp.]
MGDTLGRHRRRHRLGGQPESEQCQAGQERTRHIQGYVRRHLGTACRNPTEI